MRAFVNRRARQPCELFVNRASFCQPCELSSTVRAFRQPCELSSTVRAFVQPCELSLQPCELSPTVRALPGRLDLMNGGPVWERVSPSVQRARRERSQNVCVRVINSPQRVRTISDLANSGVCRGNRESRSFKSAEGLRVPIARLNAKASALPRRGFDVCDARWRFRQSCMASGQVTIGMRYSCAKARTVGKSYARLAKARVVGKSSRSSQKPRGWQNFQLMLDTRTPDRIARVCAATFGELSASAAKVTKANEGSVIECGRRRVFQASRLPWPSLGRRGSRRVRRYVS